MTTKKNRYHLASDWLCEASVLVLIFALLDKVFKYGLPWWEYLWRSAAIVLFAAMFFRWGVHLHERAEALEAAADTLAAEISERMT